MTSRLRSWEEQRKKEKAAQKAAEKKGYEPGQIIIIENDNDWCPYELIFIKSKFKKAKKKSTGKWWYKYLHLRFKGVMYATEEQPEGSVSWTEEEDTWKLMDHHCSWAFNPNDELSENSLKFIIKYRHPTAYVREILEDRVEEYQQAIKDLDDLD